MDTFKAVVQQIIRNGNHGPYAVATLDPPILVGSVTFSLEPTVWKESDWPEEGSVIILGNLRQKRAGWRAKLARYFVPSDEQGANTMFSLTPSTRKALTTMVAESSDLQPKKATQAFLSWSNDAAKHTSKALNNMDDGQRIDFLKGLMMMWHSASVRNGPIRVAKLAELKELIGENEEAVMGSSLIFTLSGNGEQLRCWYGHPGTFSMDHVNSGGTGLLFQVSGNRENVMRYVHGLIHVETQKFAIKLPNDAVIYGFRWDYKNCF